MKFVKVILVVSAASLVYVAAATAGEMKSDPDNYYLDPEEIRPYVLKEMEALLPSWMGKGSAFGNLTAFDVRLLEGQIPLCTVEGDVAAYIYIASVVPGSLPTLDDIVGNARAGMDVYADYRESKFRGEPFDLKGAFAERYPYEFSCVHAIVGVNEKWPYGEYCARIPTIILWRPAGEDAARSYYRSDNFEFVRYVYCSLLQGYEFTDGYTDIIVPVDRFGTIDEHNIKTRVDIEANTDEYVRKPEPEHVESYFRMWKNILGAETQHDDSYRFNIENYGPEHYLGQYEYDSQYKWRDGWEYGSDNCPLFDFGSGQHSILGKCWAISFASCMAYTDNTRSPELGWPPLKELGSHSLSGQEVCWSFYGTSGGKKKFPVMRSFETQKKDLGVGKPCNFGAYMAIIIGAAYQNYPTSGDEEEKYIYWYDLASFFRRGQQNSNYGAVRSTLNEAEEIYKDTLSDFGAYLGTGYETEHNGDLPNANKASVVANLEHLCPFVCHMVSGHCGAVYGYETVSGDLSQLAVLDWDQSAWPNSVDLEWKTIANFGNQVYIKPAAENWETIGYVRAIEIKENGGTAELTWSCGKDAEREVLGYNIIRADGSRYSLNSELIRADGVYDGGEYRFIFPPEYSDCLSIQIILKDGSAEEYPINKILTGGHPNGK